MHHDKRRAARRTPEERRAEIITAAVPLLIEHGRAVTTRQIAQAAGVSEGTLFNIFEGKDQLIDAAVEDALFSPEYLRSIRRVDVAHGLHSALEEIVRIDRHYFTQSHMLLRALDVRPKRPTMRAGADERLAARRAALLGVIESFRDELRVSADVALFALDTTLVGSSHVGRFEQNEPDPRMMVDLLLHGVGSAPADGRSSAEPPDRPGRSPQAGPSHSSPSPSSPSSDPEAR